MAQKFYKQVRSATASARSSTPVRTGTLQRKCVCSGSAGFSGEEYSSRRPTLQRHGAGPAEASPAPSIVHEVLNSSGQPLEADTRAFMEPRFGHSFSRMPVLAPLPRSRSESLVIGAVHDRCEREADAGASFVADAASAAPSQKRADFGSVRVHTDSRAAESARAVGSHAYTVGHRIVFDTGRYAPQTNEGRVLLAHELTHVLQQTGGGSAVLRRRPDGGEKEKADEPAAKFSGCKEDRQTVIQEGGSIGVEGGAGV
jgi:hypothetical protein